MKAEQSATPGSSALIELRQAQPQRQPAANVTVNPHAGYSGLSGCKSHGCVGSPANESAASVRVVGAPASAASQGAEASLSLPCSAASAAGLPSVPGAGVFAGLTTTLLRIKGADQDAQTAFGGLPTLPHAGNAGGLPTGPGQHQHPAGCAEPQRRALQAPSPGLRPDPAPRARYGSMTPPWFVHISFKNDVLEVLEFRSYITANDDAAELRRDPDILSVEIVDYLGRIVQSPDLLEMILPTDRRAPGLYRWHEPTETLIRVL